MHAKEKVYLLNNWQNLCCGELKISKTQLRFPDDISQLWVTTPTKIVPDEASWKLEIGEQIYPHLSNPYWLCSALSTAACGLVYEKLSIESDFPSCSSLPLFECC